ncbi:MAG: rhodanese-like domain-containing protein [Cruoricaptor ignavus]|nr:rhodanese-like domain-containing protein [Cruoricaptor ignavus]
MIDFIKRIFGIKKVDFKKLYESGATIVDVRTIAEFENGHILNSQNIPLQDLKKELAKLDAKKPIITCCASGVRSESARMILKQNNFEVYNGGSWSKLNSKIFK